MKLWLLIPVLAWAMLFSTLACADEPGPDGKEPPVRLKKKNKTSSETLAKPKLNDGPLEPKEETKKTEPPPIKKAQDEPESAASAEPEIDEQEMLNRIAKNMRSAENRLANKELGEDTKQVQRDILSDLDRLIDQGQNANSNSSRSSSDSSASASKSSKNSKGQQSAQSRKQGRKKSGQQMAGNQRGDQQQKENGQKPGGKQNGVPGGKTDSEGGPDKLADLYKDIWGHLPETLRAEMNAYASREEFMVKYRDLLKQYYTTIAEKGQRKGE